MLGPRLLGTELVAWAGQDLKASRTVVIVHLLVRAVVRLGDTSLGCDVNDDSRLCILRKLTDRNIGVGANAPHHDVKEVGG